MTTLRHMFVKLRLPLRNVGKKIGTFFVLGNSFFSPLLIAYR